MSTATLIFLLTGGTPPILAPLASSSRSQRKASHRRLLLIPLVHVKAVGGSRRLRRCGHDRLLAEISLESHHHLEFQLLLSFLLPDRSLGNAMKKVTEGLVHVGFDTKVCV
jgi:hypothetical protein